MNKNYKLIFILINFLTIILIFVFFPLLANGQRIPRAFQSIKWQKGPCTSNLGDISEINVPAGYFFTDANGTKDFLQIIEETSRPDELGLIISFLEKYYILFEFDPAGYIKDDEKDSLDADAMLKSIKAGNDAANQEKQKKGWPIITITGWEKLPHYNLVTHNLEWAIRGDSEGRPVINYNTRLLGRNGVMIITLVVEPSSLSAILPHYNQIIENHTFKRGQKYAEFRKGDKIAGYGLTALVVGGASAVAVKTGIFKWLWKVIVAAAAGLLALFKSLFRKKDS